jgi:DNA-binding MarR family transcriptional regulator
MPKTALLIELVQELDLYEKTMDQPDQVTMESFLGHMHAKYLQPPLNFRSLAGELEITVQNQGAERETDISVLITLLFRYAKYYTGLALEECDLNNIDEFSFVIVLMTHPSLSKTELIRQNAVEKSTGIEIINRLIKKGWMEQFPGESDKRTQRVRITEAGRKRLYPVLHDVEKVGQVLAGKLTVSERNTLHYLLRKLEVHHHQLRSHYPNATLNELIVATWTPENEEGTTAEAMAPS